MLETANHLLDTLHAISSDITIERNFRILHPQYQPFALPADVAARFELNAPELQHKYRLLLLRNFIYGIYFNASLQNVSPTPSLGVTGIYALHQNLENNSILGIDEDFYTQLDASNHGTGYFDHNWEVLRREPDGSLAITKGGLTMYAEPELHLDPDASLPQKGDWIAIAMPKNRLENGFYVAVGNVGQEQQNPDMELDLGQIYFNLKGDGAIALMNSVTCELNNILVPFSFQVLCHPSAFGRYDSGILYFEQKDYLTIRKALQTIYSQNQSYFNSQIPLFTKFLAPGLGLAETPKQKFIAQESFGMNRCQIVANALLETWEQGRDSPEARMQAIQQHFAQFGIDSHRPYLNPNSEDIYIPLN
jgi:HopA1 effector protein family